MKKTQFVLSDNTGYNVVKLGPMNPGDTYYIKDRLSGNLAKIGKDEIKKLLSNTLDKFKQCLNEVILNNLSLSLQNLISEIFNSEVKCYFEEMKNSLNLVNFKGEFNGLLRKESFNYSKSNFESK